MKVEGYERCIDPVNPTITYKNGSVHTKYAFVHVLVAEKKIGRKLRKGEEVHHIDRDKRNNDPDNLLVMDSIEHKELHKFLQSIREKEKRNKMQASIQKIVEIYPIPGADKIEAARILGWMTVVKKGEFQKDELVIFIQIDSMIPKTLLTGDKDDLQTIIRLSTVKMKGQISQGLVVKAGDFFPVEEIVEGADVSEWLGVTHYEKPVPANMSGLVKGSFPIFLNKTDEERLQNFPALLDEIKGKELGISVKCDGTSASFFKYQGVFGVCSRNLELQDGDNMYWNVARKYDIPIQIPEGMCVQGEIVGPGVQGNKMGLSYLQLRVFNIYDIPTGSYVDQFVLQNECDVMKFPCVPYILPKDKVPETLDEWLNLAKGFYEGTANQREGIVVRPVKETHSFVLGGRLSFKVLNNSYLLDNKE